jgi:hypothetical protein
MPGDIRPQSSLQPVVVGDSPSFCASLQLLLLASHLIFSAGSDRHMQVARTGRASQKVVIIEKMLGPGILLLHTKGIGHTHDSAT